VSTRLASEPLASLIAAEDIDVASRSSARLLITASTQQAVETQARRVHVRRPVRNPPSS